MYVILLPGPRFSANQAAAAEVDADVQRCLLRASRPQRAPPDDQHDVRRGGDPHVQAQGDKSGWGQTLHSGPEWLLHGP